MSIVLVEKISEMRLLVDRYAGKRLPGERELAEQLQISRPSIRSILAVLEAEGLVHRRHGSGTYPTKVKSERLQTALLLIDQEIKLGNDPFFTLLVEQIQNALQRQGIRSVLERIGKNAPLPFLEQGVITFGLAGESILASLWDEAPPVVGLLLEKNIQPTGRASIFQLADEKAGEEAVQNLFKAGYTNLKFIGNPRLPSTYKRLVGIKKAVKQAGLNLEIMECPQNFNAGIRLGKKLDLNSKTAPTGIIVANDWLALGLRAGLAEKPEGVSGIPIVSFDGLSITSDPSLNIHSLAVPFDLFAEDVVTELIRLSQSKSVMGRIISYDLYWPDTL